MQGMVFVEPAGLHGDALRHWVHAGTPYARSLPPKADGPQAPVTAPGLPWRRKAGTLQGRDPAGRGQPGARKLASRRKVSTAATRVVLLRCDLP